MSCGGWKGGSHGPDLSPQFPVESEEFWHPLERDWSGRLSPSTESSVSLCVWLFQLSVPTITCVSKPRMLRHTPKFRAKISFLS